MHRLSYLLSAALLCSTSSAASQTTAPDRPTETVAATVERFYQQTVYIDTQFTQTYTSRIHQTEVRSRGRLRISRPGRFRFDYRSPSPKVVVSDGETLVVYEPPSPEFPSGQFARSRHDHSTLARTLGIMLGTADLAANYHLRLLRSRSSFAHLELRPRRPTPYFRRLILVVSTRPDTRGSIAALIVEDDEHNRNRFTFERQRFPSHMDGSLFRFSAPTGAREVSPP